MNPSRQVRRAQERAEAKQDARLANIAPPHNPCHMSARVGYTQLVRIMEHMGELRAADSFGVPYGGPSVAFVHQPVQQERLYTKTFACDQEQAFRERVQRHGEVPIERVDVEIEGRPHYVLIAPVCQGAKPGTLRVRAYVKTFPRQLGRDAGKFTVPMAMPSDIKPGTIQDAWFKLTAHQRLAMFAAVQHRTPQGGPRDEVSV